jgi:hypothetical protein
MLKFEWDESKNQKNIEKHGIDYNLRGAAYKGQGDIKDSNLPTRKVYIFDIEIRDKEGKIIATKLRGEALEKKLKEIFGF